jgi:hypothetical protein
VPTRPPLPGKPIAASTICSIGKGELENCKEKYQIFVWMPPKNACIRGADSVAHDENIFNNTLYYIIIYDITFMLSY